MAPPSSLIQKLRACEDECVKAKADIDRIEEDKRKGLNISNIKAIDKRFKQTCDKTKKETQLTLQKQSMKKKAGSTRSGKIRGKPKESTSSDGNWITRGMDHARESLSADDIKYIKNRIVKCKEVDKLELDHIRYLIMEVFLDDLKKIQAGELASNFHERYHSLKGKSSDLLSEIRTSLFNNKQRDYISGLLQGAFKTTTKDDNGDIKFSEIKYVTIVMYAESIIRIVKYVHKFESNDEAFAYTIKRSRESLGLDEDYDQ